MCAINADGAVCPVIREVDTGATVLDPLTVENNGLFTIFKLMRQKKTIALLIGFLMFGTISHATDFPLSKLNFGNSQSEQKSLVSRHSRNLPLQDEPGSNSSTPRASLEEDEDDTAKEKISTTTILIRSDFHQPLYFTQNVFGTLDLEILTPPPQK